LVANSSKQEELMEMDIPESLTEQAFRATNGEFAWTRAQAVEVVAIVARHEVAILVVSCGGYSAPPASGAE
jgi:hypothetical protein